MCVNVVSVDEYEQGEGDEGEEGDDKEGCETPPDQGDHSKCHSTETPPVAKRGSSKRKKAQMGFRVNRVALLTALSVEHRTHVRFFFC